MGKIAIFYGTRFGGTEGIAEKIADTLASKDHIVVLKNIKEVSDFSEAEASMFDGIILGSGIQMGKWTGKTIEFITRNKAILSDEKRKLGLFVSCGNAQTEEGKLKACQDYVTKFSVQYGLTPHLAAAFGGIFDFSKRSVHGFVKKNLLKSIAKKESPGKFDLEAMNDFRNWAEIVVYAEEFAKLV